VDAVAPATGEPARVAVATVFPPPLTANVGAADGAVEATAALVAVGAVLAPGAALDAGAVVAGVPPPHAVTTAPAANAAVNPKKFRRFILSDTTADTPC
jgi:hypothetical protein